MTASDDTTHKGPFELNFGDRTAGYIEGKIRRTARMAVTKTEYKHILLDDNGVATIEGTTMKVVELVISHLTYGWSPEELHFQYPHITLGKIHSALAYYWDFGEALNAEIERRFQDAETLRQQAPPSRIAQKLRDRGLIS